MVNALALYTQQWGWYSAIKSQWNTQAKYPKCFIAVNWQIIKQCATHAKVEFRGFERTTVGYGSWNTTNWFRSHQPCTALHCSHIQLYWLFGQLFLYDFKNGPIPASFCLFSFFSRYNCDTNWKSIDCVLGIRTQGRRMVGADEAMAATPMILCSLVRTLLFI